MAILGHKEKENQREMILTDYSKRRLITYADSFRDLAESLAFEYNPEGMDRQQALENKRLWEKQEMLCKNMTEVSRILEKMAAEVFRIRPLGDRQYRRISSAMRTEKIYISDLFYMESGEKQHAGGAEKILGVRMHTQKPGGYKAEDVADMFSVLLNQCFLSAVTNPYMVEKEEQYFFFVEEPLFMVMPGYAKAIREKESISGDNYSMIENVKGRTTILLSDGMGSGQKACRDSEQVLDMMEKFLEAGYDMETAIRLLNSTLVTAEAEQNMSTLDVCDVDLYSGMCRFYKVGAAVTFLKSNTYVEQIRQDTLPLGMFQELGAETVTRELIDNDYIIMVTDGIIDALSVGGYEDMLGSYLEELTETNPGEIARKVLQFALRCSNGRIMDDMTVVVLGIFQRR